MQLPFSRYPFLRAHALDVAFAGHSDAVRALCFANGRLFSGSYDGTVRVWDAQELTCLKVLAGHTGPVRTLVCSSGHMFSGSYDKTVSHRCWGDTHLLACNAGGLLSATVCCCSLLFSS